MTKSILEYEVVDHGVDYPSYFQGCGVSFTPFDVCYTGIGDSPAEALDDALDQAADTYDVVSVTDKLSEESDLAGCLEDDDDCDEFPQHYVSIRIR